MLSKAAIIAYEKGYYIFEGEVYNNRGQKRKLKLNDKYPKFNIHYEGKIITVKCHHLTAWQKYGKECIGDDVYVRHYNDNPMDFSIQNILLGTWDQNLEDKKRNRSQKEKGK